jgi:teichuronic acid biosynthesis glycosyltransferase TuaG
MNMKNPLVSVIVTTYNRSEMLAETIQSILKQSFVDFELIIVDNMSQDATQEYVEGLQDSRIRFFKNPNHGVIAVNRNYGIREAKGVYIAFCDDDDLWMESKLDVQLQLLKNNPNCVMCYSQAESFLNNRTVKKAMVRREIKNSHFFSLLQGNYIPNSSVLIKKDVFNQIGLLNESSDLREDYEMWLRVAKCHSIIGTQQALIRYRLHFANSAGNRVAETMRAIRTLRRVASTLDIPGYIYFPNLFIQYLKYVFYKLNVRYY